MYLPLELLNNYTEKCCISWQELDLARTVYRKQHELPDELYITKMEVLFAVLVKENIAMEKENETAVSQLAWIATILSILASWRISKQVYHFEQEMEELLYSQADDGILLPVEVLKNMPYPCVYFEAPSLSGEQFHGFFACMDIESGMELLKFMPLHRDGENVQIRSIELVPGHTLRECMAKPLQMQYGRQDIGVELDKYMDLTGKMLQLVLYICAANADVQSSEPGRKTIKPGSVADIKDKYREISRWDVGNNVVKKIRNSKKASAAALESGTKKRLGDYHVSPHVRRGHWQSYWVGKKDGSEERRLVLRWKHFIYVNASDPDQFQVTINCM